MPGAVLINPSTGKPEYVDSADLSARLAQGYEVPAGSTVETISGRRLEVATPEAVRETVETGGRVASPTAVHAEREEAAYRESFNTISQEALTALEGGFEGLTFGLGRALTEDEASRYRREVNPLVHGAGVVGGSLLPLAAGPESLLGLGARPAEAARGLTTALLEGVGSGSRVGQALVRGMSGAAAGTVDGALFGLGTQAADALIGGPEYRGFSGEAVLESALLGAGIGGVLDAAVGGLGQRAARKPISNAIEANTADALSELGGRLRHSDEFLRVAKNDVSEILGEAGRLNYRVSEDLVSAAALAGKADDHLRAVLGVGKKTGALEGIEAKLAKRLKRLDEDEIQLVGRALDDYTGSLARLDDLLQPYRVQRAGIRPEGPGPGVLIDTPLGKIDPFAPLPGERIGTPEYQEALQAKLDYLAQSPNLGRPDYPGMPPPAPGPKKEVPSVPPVEEVPVGKFTENISPPPESLPPAGEKTGNIRKPAPAPEPGGTRDIRGPKKEGTADTGPRRVPSENLAPPIRDEAPDLSQAVLYQAKAPRVSRERVAGGKGGIHQMDVAQLAGMLGTDVVKVPGSGPLADAAMKIWGIHRLGAVATKAERGAPGLLGGLAHALGVMGTGRAGGKIGEAIAGEAGRFPGRMAGFMVGRQILRGVGRLASVAGRAHGIVGEAALSLLTTAAKAGAGGRVARPAVALKNLSLGPSSPDDPADDFGRLRAQLTRALQGREVLGSALDDHFAGVRAVAPDVADRAREAYLARLANYAKEMPVPPPGLYNPERWRPDPVALSTWFRYVAAAEDPFSVLRRMDVASPVEVRSVAENWPETMSELRRQLMANHEKLASLDHIRAARVSEVLGAPITATADPGLWGRQAAMYQTGESQPGQTNAGSPKSIQLDTNPTPGQAYSTMRTP